MTDDRQPPEPLGPHVGGRGMFTHVACRRCGSPVLVGWWATDEDWRGPALCSDCIEKDNVEGLGRRVGNG